MLNWQRIPRILFILCVYKDVIFVVSEVLTMEKVASGVSLRSTDNEDLSISSPGSAASNLSNGELIFHFTSRSACRPRPDFSLVISLSVKNGQNLVKTDRNQSVGGPNVQQNFSNTTPKSAVALTDVHILPDRMPTKVC